MGMYPSTMLLLRITPQDDAEETFKQIISGPNFRVDRWDEGGDDEELDVELCLKHNFTVRQIKDEWDDYYQITGEFGDIVVFKSLTNNYGDTITWLHASQIKDVLEEWVKTISASSNIRWDIFLQARYS